MYSVYLGTMGVLEYDAWMLFRQVYELCETIQKRECQLAGISVSAFEVLYLIKSQPKPLTAYRLATLLGHQHHSVVEIVNRLRRKGLVERQSVNGKSSLEITEAGDQILVKALSRPILGQVVASLGPDHIKRLMEDLMPLRERAMQELGLLDRGEIKLQPLSEMRALGNHKGSSQSKPQSHAG